MSTCGQQKEGKICKTQHEARGRRQALLSEEISSLATTKTRTPPPPSRTDRMARASSETKYINPRHTSCHVRQSVSRKDGLPDPSEPTANTNLYRHRALSKPGNYPSHSDTLLSTAPRSLRTKPEEQRICFLCVVQLGQAPRASQKRHVCIPAGFKALKVISGLCNHRRGPIGPACAPKASSHIFLGPEALYSLMGEGERQREDPHQMIPQSLGDACVPRKPLPPVLLQSWPGCPRAHMHVHSSPQDIRLTQDRAAGAAC